MKSKLAVFGIATAALVLAVSTVYAFANAPEKGSMGAWGYVASGRDASLAMAERQSGIASITVAHVCVPEPAWIVVSGDAMSGRTVGLKHINAGTTTGLILELDGVESKGAIVSVYADRGVPGRFDFDPKAKTTSPDKPFFVNGKELAQTVALR
jgi:hypothetical protein